MPAMFQVVCTSITVCDILKILSMLQNYQLIKSKKKQPLTYLTY